MTKSKEVAIVSAEELSLVENNMLNSNQLSFILKKTPEKYLKARPAKGGGTWDYVSGGYVKKCLNLMFGWDWDFEITEQLIMHGEAIVKGKLTCRTNGRIIVKTQFGNKDIAYKKQSDQEKTANAEKIPLSIGNDLKAAATDCLKKCASELGIAADVYNKEEFREIQVDTSTVTKEMLQELYDAKKEGLTIDQQTQIETILNENDKVNYKKTFQNLSKL